MTAQLENIMFFNDGMCRYKSWGDGKDREMARRLASIEVSEEHGTRIYTVQSLYKELDGGKKDDERVILHTKSLINAYQGKQVLGATASVWSLKDDHVGKFMVIGPITKLVFVEENDLTFNASIYWHLPERNH